MSQQLISRSPDLHKLREEGYDVEIRAAHLLVKDVPYLTAARQIKRGILVSELTVAGDITSTPSTHVAMFIGDYPCNADGVELESIRHGGGQHLASDLLVDFSFSSRPVGSQGYRDYYEKMTTYAAILVSRARRVDPEITAQQFLPIEVREDESVFEYLDTVTSRAGIGSASSKLAMGRVAIVGLGGTGSYVLDLIAKTPVREIHLFDGDIFLSHNAFRAPGAASIHDLRARQPKVEYLGKVYSAMRRGIVRHSYHIQPSNVSELHGMDFVFLCIDRGGAKRAIVESLELAGVPFVDVGMGVDLVDSCLRGQLRVTLNTPVQREHFRKRVSLGDTNVDDEYGTNIQVADLNAMNAVLAVIKWKKFCGFYLDLANEFQSCYATDGHSLINDDALDDTQP